MDPQHSIRIPDALAHTLALFDLSDTSKQLFAKRKWYKHYRYPRRVPDQAISRPDYQVSQPGYKDAQAQGPSDDGARDKVRFEIGRHGGVGSLAHVHDRR
jgi:hypothetical protein